MQTTWNEALHALSRGEMLRIHGGEGASVVVFSGRVWLTQDGDLRDIHLGAGESFTLDVAEPALVQALEPAQVVLVEAPRARAAAGWSALGAALGRWLQDLVARVAGGRRMTVVHRPAAA